MSLAMDSCMRVTLFVLNFIFFLAGGAALGFGIYSKVTHKDLLFSMNQYETLPILMMTVGAIVVVISLLGFCGAIKMSRCCLLIYTGLLTMMLLIEVGLAIAGYFLRDKIKASMKKSAKKYMKSDYPRLSFVRDMVDGVQSQMGCCGVSNYTDWTDSKWRKQANNTGVAVPRSCCVDSNHTSCNAANSDGSIRDLSKIHTKGCAKAIESAINKNLQIILIVACCVAGIQLIGVILGYCLMSSIRSEE